jgi:hypothetical protein
MKARHAPPSLPVHDYRGAFQSARCWLGDRYLLAVPVSPWLREHALRALFLESVSWLRPQEDLHDISGRHPDRGTGSGLAAVAPTAQNPEPARSRSRWVKDRWDSNRRA